MASRYEIKESLEEDIARKVVDQYMLSTTSILLAAKFKQEGISQLQASTMLGNITENIRKGLDEYLTTTLKNTGMDDVEPFLAEIRLSLATYMLDFMADRNQSILGIMQSLDERDERNKRDHRG